MWIWEANNVTVGITYSGMLFLEVIERAFNGRKSIKDKITLKRKKR